MGSTNCPNIYVYIITTNCPHWARLHRVSQVNARTICPHQIRHQVNQIMDSCKLDHDSPIRSSNYVCSPNSNAQFNRFEVLSQLDDVLNM